MDLNFLLFSIVNIFFTPFISVLIDNAINRIDIKPSLSAFVKYATYLVFVFLFSKSALFVLQIALDSQFGTYSVQYSILAILFSIILPLIVNIFAKRYDIEIVIKNEKK